MGTGPRIVTIDHDRHLNLAFLPSEPTAHPRWARSVSIEIRQVSYTSVSLVAHHGMKNERPPVVHFSPCRLLALRASLAGAPPFLSVATSRLRLGQRARFAEASSRGRQTSTASRLVWVMAKTIIFGPRGRILPCTRSASRWSAKTERIVRFATGAVSAAAYLPGNPTAQALNCAISPLVRVSVSTEVKPKRNLVVPETVGCIRVRLPAAETEIPGKRPDPAERMKIPIESFSRIQALFVRPRLHWRDPSTILLSVALGIIVVTFQDYGITWDESARNAYGHHVLNYYLSFSQDTSALHVGNLYGGLFDGLAAAIQAMSPFGHYETRHLLNAICGWLTLIGVMKLGSLAGGPWGGFFAVLFLLLSPRFYGHMFNNPKDIPFALGYLWSVYYLVRTLPHWPRIPTGLVFKIGISIGVALGVRVGGLLLIAYLLMIWGLTLLYQLHERNGAGLYEALRKGGGSCLQVVLIAWTVMLVAWPWAQGSLLRPFQALEEMAHFTWKLAVYLTQVTPICSVRSGGGLSERSRGVRAAILDGRSVSRVSGAAPVAGRVSVSAL